MTDSNEKFWEDFDHNTPAAFWDVHIWDGGPTPGSLDVADRRRITVGVLEYLENKLFTAIMSEETEACNCPYFEDTSGATYPDTDCSVHRERETDEDTA